MLSYLYYPITAVVNMFYYEQTQEINEEKDSSPKIISSFSSNPSTNTFYMSKPDLDKQIGMLKKTNYEKSIQETDFTYKDIIKNLDRKHLFETKNNVPKINDLNITLNEKRKMISEMLRKKKQNNSYAEKMNKIKQNPILRKKYKQELADFELKQKNEIEKNLL